MGIVSFELGIVHLFQLPDLLTYVSGLAVAKEFGGSLQYQFHLLVARLHMIQLVLDAAEGIVVKIQCAHIFPVRIPDRRLPLGRPEGRLYS